MLKIFQKYAPALAFTLVVAAAAGPALAQFSGGGGGAVPFQQGLSVMLNWVFIAGAFIAVTAFILACIFLFMRNLIGFFGGVVVGGGLMANAPQLVATLTRLRTITAGGY